LIKIGIERINIGVGRKIYFEDAFLPSKRNKRHKGNEAHRHKGNTEAIGEDDA